MDIKIGGIRMCAGKQELLDSAVLALNYGVKYGLVGRNGVGKTTLLRHLADGRITLPKFLNVVHVEQEDEAVPSEDYLQKVRDAAQTMYNLLTQSDSTKVPASTDLLEEEDDD